MPIKQEEMNLACPSQDGHTNSIKHAHQAEYELNLITYFQMSSTKFSMIVYTACVTLAAGDYWATACESQATGFRCFSPNLGCRLNFGGATLSRSKVCEWF